MSRNSSDLIDARLEEHQLCGSKQCPSCGHQLEAKPDYWVGLPAGVKFDPTDQELIGHLEAKVQAKDMIIKSHPLIDEFIPTIEGEDGICYTHPEKLPGVTRDGLSRHFFHRPSKAYTTGTRKRRKIQNESCDLQGTGETRWHKTGKTRTVVVNGRQKGCKKILVLYTNFGKNRKPEKTNWVMHQYHLGPHEEEKEGELVVSKIFYQTQPRQCNWSDRSVNTGEGSSTDHNNSRRDSGSGSCSSKEISINPHHSIRDELPGASVAAAVPNYGTIDISRLKSDHHLSFVPFRKIFDKMGIAEASTARDGPLHGTFQEMHDQRSSHHSAHDHHHQQLHHHHHQQQQQHQIGASTAFHISRPSHPISTIISPSPLHHTSVILDENPYHVPRIMLQNETFQQQQHHHKLEGRSGSGLEELIMGCTSSYIKEEPSIPNPQEAEWLLKYSSFWPDHDGSQDHHGQ